MKLDFPWNKNNKIDELNKISSRKEILAKFKDLANPNCKQCHGLGHCGYREKTIKSIKNKIIKQRIYIACPKCIDN